MKVLYKGKDKTESVEAYIEGNDLHIVFADGKKTIYRDIKITGIDEGAESSDIMSVEIIKIGEKDVVNLDKKE